MKKEEKNVKKIYAIGGKKFCSDTFVCDKCGTRMFLKIMGDSTPCKAPGCNGTMHRV